MIKRQHELIGVFRAILQELCMSSYCGFCPGGGLSVWDCKHCQKYFLFNANKDNPMFDCPCHRYCDNIPQLIEEVIDVIKNLENNEIKC